MITAQERQRLVDGWGYIGEEPGWAEERIGSLQALHMLVELLIELDNRGMTQADLARAMGVHRRQITRWMRGDGGVKAEIMIAIGRHMGLRLETKWVPMDAEMAIAPPVRADDFDADDNFSLAA